MHQHARNGNDDPRNGLALTPDAHWMFDAGLWTAIPKGDDFIIKVAIGRFTESSPHGRLLSKFHGQGLTFHEHASMRPDATHLAWHRQHHRI
ncbi:MAG: HNH endonuclease [Verrucomicrobia bacterium]|nr:HNH endonuclease [Verrucomicrobiota bacterium]